MEFKLLGADEFGTYEWCSHLVGQILDGFVAPHPNFPNLGFPKGRSTFEAAKHVDTLDRVFHHFSGHTLLSIGDRFTNVGGVVGKTSHQAAVTVLENVAETVYGAWPDIRKAESWEACPVDLQEYISEVQTHSPFEMEREYILDLPLMIEIERILFINAAPKYLLAPEEASQDNPSATFEDYCLAREQLREKGMAETRDQIGLWLREEMEKTASSRQLSTFLSQYKMKKK